MQTQAITVPVEIGAPTFNIFLKYEKLYEPKPFRDAVVLLYDNGVYKILSPGENHYGVYVIKGMFQQVWEMNFISLPHADWYDNVAQHTLNFNADTKLFGQRAYLPSDPDIPKQHGSFQMHPNTITDPREVNWDDIPQPR